MFDNYISKLPNFVPNIDNPVAQHANYCPQSTTMTTYAAALKSKTTNSNQNTTTQASKCFIKPLQTYQPQNLDFNLDPTEFPDTITNKPTIAPTTATTQTSKNTTTTTTNNSNTQMHTTHKATASNTAINLEALQCNILQNICSDINQHIQQQIQKKVAEVKSDLLGIKDLHGKHDDINEHIANMQNQLDTLLKHMSSLMIGGGMK